MRHYKQGKHGKSRKQAVAIGISKARRHGVPYPEEGKSRKSNRREANQERTKSSLYNQARNSGPQQDGQKRTGESDQISRLAG
jgi:hypothetical protein